MQLSVAAGPRNNHLKTVTQIPNSIIPQNHYTVTRLPGSIIP
jgi:hypothetical protein